MDELYYVKIAYPEEGTRTFIFSMDSDKNAEGFAASFANDWGEPYELASWGPAIGAVDGVMEICTW